MVAPVNKSASSLGNGMWGELSALCCKLHRLLYESGNRAAARRHRLKLAGLIAALPDDEAAIIRVEAMALLDELENRKKQAIAHRRKEIMLMKRLHASVAKSVEEGRYDVRTAESILIERGADALRQRQGILKALEGQVRPRPQLATPVRRRRRTGKKAA